MSWLNQGCITSLIPGQSNEWVFSWEYVHMYYITIDMNIVMIRTYFIRDKRVSVW